MPALALACRPDAATLRPIYQRLRSAAISAARRNNAALYFSEDPVLGPELVTNGTFDTNMSGWTSGSDPLQVVATWDAGRAKLTRGTGGSAGGLTQTVSTVAGKAYCLSFSSDIGVAFRVDSGVVGTIVAGAGVYNYSFVATGATASPYFWNVNTSTVVYLDNISVREILNADTFGYQDAAGTLPSYLGGPMGLWLDKSYGLERGDQLVTNGTFDSGTTTGWAEALGSGASIAAVSGALQITAGTTGARAYQVFSTSAGKSYRVTITKAGGTAVNSGYRVTTDSTGGPTGQIAAETSIAGDWNRDIVFVATASQTTVGLIIAVGSGTANFDNISVRELKGVHLTQATAGAKPTAAKPVKYPLLSCDGDSLAAPSSIIGANLSQPYTMIASGVVGALGLRRMVGDSARRMGIDSTGKVRLIHGGTTDVTGSETVTVGQSIILSAYWNGTTANFLCNNVSAFSGSVGAPVTAATATTVGQTGATSEYWNGSLDLIAICPAVMPDADRKAIERFAAFRLAITYAG